MNPPRLVNSFFFKVCLVMASTVVCATVSSVALLSSRASIPLWMALTSCIVVDGILLSIAGLIIRRWYYYGLIQPILHITDLVQTSQSPPSQGILIGNRRGVPEIHLLASSVTTRLVQFHTLLAQIQETNQKILATSQHMLTIAKTQSSTLAAQIKPGHDMATAVRELALTAQHISHDIHSVVEVANKTLQFAEQGQLSVLTVVKSMEEIRRTTQVSSDKVLALEKRSEHINDVVKTIDRLIEDTKLIAFNATIEATRAKDEGKGFGVVALEIKRLAEEVFESTEDIKTLIQEIQSASHALVLATEDDVKTVQRGVLLAEEAGAALRQILNMVKLTTDSAQRIASATQQQQSASEHVLHAVETTTRSTEQFSRELRSLTATAADINSIAEGLQHVLAQHNHPWKNT